MLNLWMFIAVELHIFHNIATVKKSTNGCKIWQVNLPNITPPCILYVGVKSGATP